MTCSYKLTENFSNDDDEEEENVTYGIIAVDASGKTLVSFSDVFFDKSKAEHFVAVCNRLSVSLLHLKDAVEDALTEQYMV